MILWKQLNSSFRRACHRSLRSISAIPACDGGRRQLQGERLALSNGPGRHPHAGCRSVLVTAHMGILLFFFPNLTYIHRMFIEHLLLLTHHFLNPAHSLPTLLKGKCRCIFRCLMLSCIERIVSFGQWLATWEMEIFEVISGASWGGRETVWHVQVCFGYSRWNMFLLRDMPWLLLQQQMRDNVVECDHY